MKICKNCGETNSNETGFCVNCGKNEFLQGDELQCPHCGATNDNTFTHCTNCGNSLSTPESQNMPVSESASSTVESKNLTDFSEIEEIVPKETVKCFRCGTEIQINSIFCYKCGAPVSTLHEHRVLERKICKHCDTPNLPENPYCSYCYASMEGTKAEEFQLVHETVNVGKLTVKRAILSGASGKYKICNNCGALEKPNTDFCDQCGLSLDFKEQKKYCANCGAENASDAQFCTKCQWSFEGEKPQEKSDQWTCLVCQHLNNGQNQFCNHCGEKKIKE